MEDGDIVLDDRRFPDDEGRRVVEQDAAADAGGGVDVHREGLAGDALEIQRQPAAVVLPELVGHAVGRESQEALEKKQRFQRREAGRIALEHRQQIPRRGVDDHRILLENIGHQRLHARARHVFAAKPPGEPGSQGSGKGRSGKDHIVDEVLERGLLRHDPVGLAAQGVPDVAEVRDLARAELGAVQARRGKSGLLEFAHEDFTETGIRLPGDDPTGEIP